MTSVADLYFKEIGNDIATPPDSLIELFTEWISENPDLCSETQPPLDLPSGAIPMALISPTEGIGLHLHFTYTLSTALFTCGFCTILDLIQVMLNPNFVYF